MRLAAAVSARPIWVPPWGRSRPLRAVRAWARRTGVVERFGPGVTLVSPGITSSRSSRRSAEVRPSPERADERCTAIRDIRGRGIPDGTTRLSRDGEPIRHFMGTSTFAEYTVTREIALARSPRGLARGCAPFVCGLRRESAPRLHRRRSAWIDCVVSAVGSSARRCHRLLARRAERMIAIDLGEGRWRAPATMERPIRASRR